METIEKKRMMRKELDQERICNESDNEHKRKHKQKETERSQLKET